MVPWNERGMREVVQQAVVDGRRLTHRGKLADYIPELAKEDPHKLAAVVMSDKGAVSAGECGDRFTLQSISKIISLIVALCEHGADRVFHSVGKEPTGDPFNSIVKLESTVVAKPLNPMINAGAIAVCSLIPGASVGDRLAKIANLLGLIVGRTVTFDRNVYESEFATGDRNRALAYFMKDTGVLTGDINEVLDLYFHQCALEVSCEELASIGLFLARKGVLLDGTRLIPADIVRLATTFMVTCGMYNASGEFAIDVGIPAKSGVSGGILATVPDRLGIGVYGPALDAKGNSIGGIYILKALAAALDLSIF